MPPASEPRATDEWKRFSPATVDTATDKEVPPGDEPAQISNGRLNLASALELEDDSSLEEDAALNMLSSSSSSVPPKNDIPIQQLEINSSRKRPRPDDTDKENKGNDWMDLESISSGSSHKGEERLEELDEIFMAEQEEDLLRRLDQELELVETEKRSKSTSTFISTKLPPNSLIQCISVAKEYGGSETDDDWPSVYPPPSVTASRTKLTHQPGTKTISSLIQKQIYKAMKSLPKLYHGETLIFTKAEFFTSVVDYITKEHTRVDPMRTWTIDLVEHPQSYTLVYRGPKALLDAIAVRTEGWIQYRLTYLKHCHLLKDPENLLLEVEMDSVEHLGGQLGTPFCLIDLPLKQQLRNDEGVWFTSTDLSAGISRYIGSRALEAGCAILNINYIPVTSQSQVCEQLLEAKKEGDKMVVTLCISKHADLAQIHRVIHRLRRRDGESFLPEYYQELRIEWLAHHKKKKAPSSKNERSSWVEYPSRPVIVPSSYPRNAPVTPGLCLKLAKRILSSTKSVEVDLSLTGDTPLGCEIVDEGFGPMKQGIWCRKISKKGQLGKALGPNAVHIGGILLRARGVGVHSQSQLQAVLDKANLLDGSYRATFLFFEGTDFSGVNRKNLVQGRTNPRYRNGEPYPLHLTPYVPPSEDADKEEDVMLSDLLTKNKVGTEKVLTDQNGKKKKDRARTRDGQVPEKAPKKSKLDPPKTPVDHAQSFKNFQKKYSAAERIEFGNTPVKHVQGISYMWLRHKAIMGKDAFCDDKCLCVNRVGKLQKNVARYYIEDQEARGVKVDPKEIKGVGFLTNFKRKFMPKLKKEYPDESLRQLLDRLVAMWPIHVKQRIYGLTCNENCECEESWDLLFGRGDPSKLKQGQPDRPKKVIRTLMPQPETLVPTKPLIPRKRKTDADKKPPLLSKYISPALMAAERNQGGRPPQEKVELDGYKINFDASAPLGMFLMDTDFQLTVRSVDPTGQARTRDKHKRVQNGTIIQAMVVDAKPVPISNLQTLIKKYEKFQKEKKNFTLVLSNLAVDRSTTSKTSKTSTEWSRTGAWQGEQLDGWAGGALSATNEKQKGGSERKAKKTEQGRTAASVSDVSRLVFSAIQPGHRTKPAPTPILRKRGQSASSNSVVFDEENIERRDFDPRSKAAERLIRISELESSDVVGDQDSRSPRDKLIDAVGQEECRDLIELLQNGAAADPRITTSCLQEVSLAAKKLITSTREQLSCKPDDKMLKAQLADLEAKRVVLKIYIASRHFISNAMSLTSWQWLEIKVTRVEIQKRAGKFVQGRTDVLGGRALCRIEGQQQDVLGQLPPQGLFDHITYDDPATFMTSNNIHFEAERRDFALELLEGSAQDSVPPKKLGEVSFPLNVVDRKCSNDGATLEYRCIISPNDQLKSGEVTFVIRRRRVSPEWIHHRRAEAQKGIISQVDAIVRFNSDHNPEIYGNLTGHIQTTGGVTLLHAAIILQEVDQVQRLVELGVDPRERSDMGTSIGFAAKFRDAVSEKLQNRMKNQDKVGEGAVEKTKQLLEKYERMVALLRGIGDDSQDDDGEAVQQNPSGDSAADQDEPAAELEGQNQGAKVIDKENSLATTIGATEQAETSSDEGQKATNMNNEEDKGDDTILHEAIQNVPPAPGYSKGEAILVSSLRDWLQKSHPEYGSETLSQEFCGKLMDSGKVIAKDSQHGNIFFMADGFI